jgi:hypothetical protein
MLPFKKSDQPLQFISRSHLISFLFITVFFILNES